MLKKCGWLLASILLVFTCFFAVPTFVHADSGWDSDYGGSDWGGSDWDSGSDWSSSSDWDYDYDSGSSSSHSGSGDGSVVAFIFIAWVVIMFIIVYYSARSNQNYGARRDKEKELQNIGDEDALVQKFFPMLTEKALLNVLVQKFISVQNAWENFDYPALEELCTKELYETYKSDLEILHAKGQKNVMSDFKTEAADLSDIQEENGLVTVSIYLHMSFHDYVINEKTGDIVYGDKNFIHHNQYNIDFVVSKYFGSKCPNCGAKLEGEAKCPYCASPISNMYKDFMMSKKSKIS